MNKFDLNTLKGRMVYTLAHYEADDLARKMDISLSQAYRVKKGGSLTFENAAKLCIAIGWSLDWIARGTGPMIIDPTASEVEGIDDLVEVKEYYPDFPCHMTANKTDFESWGVTQNDLRAVRVFADHDHDHLSTGDNLIVHATNMISTGLHCGEMLLSPNQGNSEAEIADRQCFFDVIAEEKGQFSLRLYFHMYNGGVMKFTSEDGSFSPLEDIKVIGKVLLSTGEYSRV